MRVRFDLKKYCYPSLSYTPIGNKRIRTKQYSRFSIYHFKKINSIIFQDGYFFSQLGYFFSFMFSLKSTETFNDSKRPHDTKS